MVSGVAPWKGLLVLSQKCSGKFSRPCLLRHERARAQRDESILFWKSWWVRGGVIPADFSRTKALPLPYILIGFHLPIAFWHIYSAYKTHILLAKILLDWHEWFPPVLAELRKQNMFNVNRLMFLGTAALGKRMTSKWMKGCHFPFPTSRLGKINRWLTMWVCVGVDMKREERE